jgi:hypothetical protein
MATASASSSAASQLPNTCRRGRNRQRSPGRGWREARQARRARSARRSHRGQPGGRSVRLPGEGCRYTSAPFGATALRRLSRRRTIRPPARSRGPSTLREPRFESDSISTGASIRCPSIWCGGIRCPWIEGVRCSPHILTSMGVAHEVLGHELFLVRGCQQNLVRGAQISTGGKCSVFTRRRQPGGIRTPDHLIRSPLPVGASCESRFVRGRRARETTPSSIPG